MAVRLTLNLRRLMAVLGLLATFTFQGRLPSADGHAGVESVHVVLEAPHALAPHLGQESAHSTPAAPVPADQHGAHCPFCLSNAFASLPEAPSVPALRQPELRAPRQHAGSAWIRAVGHPDARAPPTAGLS